MTVQKHLYIRMNGHRQHSTLCWCEQLKENSMTDRLYPDVIKLMYPHEADDPYCRCDVPLVKLIMGAKEERCILCEKPLEKSD